MAPVCRSRSHRFAIREESLLQLAVGAWRESQRVVALSVVGALLLIAVATGDAEAMMLGPQGDGDGDGDGEDADGIDGLTIVASTPTCSGLYGVGKTVIDLGVPLVISDPDDDSREMLNPVFEAALATASRFDLDDITYAEKHGRTSVIFYVEVCVEGLGPTPPGLFKDFTAPFELAFNIDTADEGVACSGDLHMAIWATPETVEGDGSFGEELVREPGPTWGYAGPTADALSVNAMEEAAFALVAEAAKADVLDCTGSTSTVAAAPVSRLGLSCEPTVASVGQRITCEVTGGDPNATILWSASASPAFAGQGVTLDADGGGSFVFVVPASARGRAITVELVEWDRSALVQVAGAAIVPSSVPAGEGSGPQRGLLLVGVALLSAAGVRSRRGRGVLARTG